MKSRISQYPRRLLMALVRAYRLVVSPWLGNSCRFEPTCSVYALQALDRHGATVGSGLTVGRLLRCHPWCSAGFDPIPVERPAFFSSLLRPGASRPCRPADHLHDRSSK